MYTENNLSNIGDILFTTNDVVQMNQMQNENQIKFYSIIL